MTPTPPDLPEEKPDVTLPAQAESPEVSQRQGRLARREPIAQWVLSMRDPLISTVARHRIDDQALDFARAEPVWFSAFVAGYLYELMNSLPAEDPWRCLSVRLVLPHSENGAELRWGPACELAAPPGTVTLLPDRSVFGHPRDAHDLVAPEMGNPASDIGLIAVAEPLHPFAAAMVGLASETVEKLADAAASIRYELGLAAYRDEAEPDPDVTRFDVASQALRRALFRRRSYLGFDDEFPALAGYHWITRADQYLLGLAPLDAPWSERTEAAIEDGMYRYCTVAD